MGNQIDPTRPPVFNGKYKIKSQIGEGKTAMVYLAETVAEDPEKVEQVAIKINKKSIKRRSSKRNLFACNSTNDAQELSFAKKEMEIHSGLKHETITKVIDCGENGKVVK